MYGSMYVFLYRNTQVLQFITKGISIYKYLLFIDR